MIRVLFVCLGNICRSPMAEAVFRHKLTKENMHDKIEVDSAGTSNYHIGSPPHKGTRAILEGKKITFDGLKARQVQKNDWNTFDYIIAMDEQNIEDLTSMNNQPEGGPVVKKLMDFVQDPEEGNVPDPYFTGDFDYTYKLVETGCENLLQHIIKHHNLKH